MCVQFYHCPVRNSPSKIWSFPDDDGALQVPAEQPTLDDDFPPAEGT